MFIFLCKQAQKENHLRAVHSGDGGMEIKEEDSEMCNLPLFAVVENDAFELIGCRNGLYLMKYLQRVEWMSLSKDDSFVKEFESDQEDEKSYQLPAITAENLREWMEKEMLHKFVEADF